MNPELPPDLRQSILATEFRIDSLTNVPEISSRLNECLLDGGKRFRPALVYWIAGILGRPALEVTHLARAAEWVHAASLAHDDVIDEANLRRERPTLNAVTGNRRAVLAGDLLLARVMVELAERAPLEVIRALAQTIESLVEGEWLQMEAIGVLDIDAHRLEKACLLKTGSLIRWCCSSSTTGELSLVLAKMGEEIGMGFQLVDDVLDFSPGSGKAVGGDLREGLVNWVAHEMMQIDPAARVQIQAALGKPEAKANWDAALLERAKLRVRSRAQNHLNRATRLLDRAMLLLPAPPAEHQLTYANSFKSTLIALGERTQ